MKLPKDDEKTLELFCSGHTKGVFQFESEGMQAKLRDLRPENFADVYAMTALYRPGPLSSGMVQEFIARRHGFAKIDYPHPKLEPVLKETYGVMVYQEQVMQAAQVLAGYSPGEADMLRRAMGKKKPAVMAAQKERFVNGARDVSGLEGRDAEAIFELMAGFAGYGFNKSHSVAYSELSWQCAYLKAHHPSAFMAATLSARMGDQDKFVTACAEARRMGLRLMAPSINESGARLSAEGEEGVRFGLGTVRSLGARAVESIIAERNAGGRFRSPRDFVDRVKIPKNALSSLIEAGAFGEFGGPGQVSAEVVRVTSPTAEMFEVSEEVGEWDAAKIQGGEKRSLGIYLTSHPMEGCVLSDLASHEAGAERGEHTREVVLAGVVTKLDKVVEKRSQGIAIKLTVEDLSGQCVVNLPPDKAASCGEIDEGDLVLVGANVRRFGKSERLDVDTIDEYGTALRSRATMVRVSSNDPQTIAKCGNWLRGIEDGRCVVVMNGEKMSRRIALDPNTLDTMRDAGAVANVEFGQQEYADHVRPKKLKERKNALTKNRKERRRLLGDLSSTLVRRSA